MDERQGSTGFDRRRFIKGAATVAWATPAILTLGAGSANAQVPSPGQCLGSTGRPENCPCSASSQCAGGCCCDYTSTGNGFCTTEGDCDTQPFSCM
jgi:hypothetical protein